MIPYFTFSQIQLGPIYLQVWGIFTVLGFLGSLYLSLKEAKRKNIREDDVWNIMILALIGMIIGSKFFYDIFSGDFDLMRLAIFSGGGFSLIGGFLLGSLLVYFYARSKKTDIWLLADVLTPGLILALIFVRIGCFLVYEHVGGLTDLPWGSIYLDQSIRHPVSLYLLIGNVVIFSIIWYLRKRQPVMRDGSLFLTFISYYSISRFFLDFTRCDDLIVCDYRYFGLTCTQWILLISIPIILHFSKKIIKINSNN